MDQNSHPMETVLGEIERALNAELYYLAVVLALTLPDMCAALESDDGRTTPDKYKAWYDANLAGDLGWLTAADCYSIRCGVVHQGRLGFPGKQFARVIFSVPTPQKNIFHNNVINDALQFDVVLFTRTIVNAVRGWMKLSAANPNVQVNLPNLIQYRPQGLAPYMVGMPVIA